MSRASFRRSGAAAPPSSTTPLVLNVNVDIPSLIVHLDTMSMLLSRSNVGREGALDVVLQPLENDDAASAILG